MKFFLIIISFTFLYSCSQVRNLGEVDSRFVSVDDIDVHYKLVGKGDKKMVFVHGWGCDMNVWEKQWKYFYKDAQLIFIDLPGFGKSSKPKINYDQDLFAKALNGVLTELEVTDPILISHSLGYPVCRQLIRNHPELDPKLVIVDGVYFKIPQDSIKKAEYLNQLQGFASMFEGKQREQNIDQFIHSLFVASTPEETRKYATETMSQTDAYVGNNTMKNLIDPKIWKEDVSAVPCLAIYADIPELPKEDEDYLKELFPNLEYHRIKDSGHFIMLDQADVFNQLLLEFIK